MLVAIRPLALKKESFLNFKVTLREINISIWIFIEFTIDPEY